MDALKQAVRRPRSRSVAIAAGCALLAGLLGATVVAGWYGHWMALVRVRPQFAPMVYNTAFNLVMLSLGLLSFCRRQERWGATFAGLAAGFGFLTLLEYSFGLNFGIDQLFLKDYVLARNPGRMSPLTAFCFTLQGTALVLAVGERAQGFRALLLGALSSAVAALCVMAIFGYLTGLTGTYGWGQFTPMALHTSVGLCLLSCGSFALAWRRGRTRQGNAPAWLPLPVALAALLGSLVLSQALQGKQHAEMERTNQAKVADATNQIRTQVDSRLLALRRMAQRRGASDQSEALWRSDAKNYIADFNGFQAIEWADKTFVIRWVEPTQGNEAALNLDLSKEKRRFRAVQLARELNEPILTRPVRLVQGGSGLLSYVPVSAATVAKGYIIGVIRTQELFDSILPRSVASGYGISIRDADAQIYVRDAPKPEKFEAWEVHETIEFHGVSWVVSVWPSPTVVAHQSQLPLLVLIVGAFAAALLAQTVYLAQNGRDQARQARRAVRALQYSEERFRMAFDDAPIGMALVDLAGRWQQVNRALCRMLGYTEPELLAANFQQVTHPADLTTDFAFLEKVLAGELASYQMEKRYLKKTGEIVNVMLSLSLVRDARGQPLHFVSQVEDITERKHTLETLRESEERFRLVVEGVTDYALLMLDPEGKIASWNAGAERLKGYKAKEIIGRHFSIFYPPEAVASGLPARELEGATRVGRYEDEGWRVRKDGSLFWASVVLTPIRDQSGKLRGFAKITHDLSERRSAANLLREIVSLQNAVLDNAAYSIIAGDPKGTITVFNATAERMLGYSAEEMINKQSPAIIHLESEIVARAAEFSAELGYSIEPGFEVFVAKSRLNLPNEHEWTYVRKNRETFPVLLSVTALRDEAGEVTGFLGLANDITERKKQEKERRQLLLELEENNRDLLRQNREIQNFYHTLSHELKTPLTSTREFVSIILDGLAGEINAEQREYLEIAQSGCKQLQVCINDLLDVTRLETGKLSVDLKEAELGPFLTQVVGGLQPMAQERELALELEIGPDLPPLRFDKSRLTQVVNNLVGNAFKFTPAGGKVTVRVHPPAAHLDFVAVSVQDTGRGIPPEKLERIFERLYQVKESDASTEQGMGLGLYISRELVQLHGGRFEVKSELEKGSEFTFYLPRAPQEDARRRVLVVDDEPEIREALRAAFEPAGFDVSLAEDGRAALALASERLPDLVVLDLKMPNVDGPTLLRELRQRSRSLPVIIHTGYPAGQLMHDAWSWSPFTVLAKPCSMQQMVAAARTQLRDPS